MKILITGTSGMLGKDIYNEFANNGFIVYGVDLFKNPKLPSQFQRIGDLTDKDFVISVLEEIKPDTIVNCAAIVNLETCQKNKELAYAVHVQVTKYLVQFKSIDTKLIYISTDSVFDGKKGNYSEKDIPNPINYYAKSKFEGETSAAKTINYLVVRTNIFGFNTPMKSSLAEWAIKNLQNGKKIEGFTDIKFNAIYTKTLAVIIVKLLLLDKIGVIHVASKNTISKYQFLLNIAKELNISSELIGKSLSSKINFKVPRPEKTNLNTSKIQKYIEMPSIEECVHELIQDFRLNENYKV